MMNNVIKQKKTARAQAQAGIGLGDVIGHLASCGWVASLPMPSEAELGEWIALFTPAVLDEGQLAELRGYLVRHYGHSYAIWKELLAGNDAGQEHSKAPKSQALHYACGFRDMHQNAMESLEVALGSLDALHSHKKQPLLLFDSHLSCSASYFAASGSLPARVQHILDELQLLHFYLSQVSFDLPKGRPKDERSYHLVRALACIWQGYTGEIPKRRFRSGRNGSDTIGEHGPFLELCQSFSASIRQHLAEAPRAFLPTDQAIETQVRKIIREMKKEAVVSSH